MAYKGILTAVVDRDIEFLRENLESNLFKKIINYMDNNDKLTLVGDDDSDVEVTIANVKFIIGLNIDRS